MKLASLSFFAALAYIHRLDDLQTALAKPLSVFRDGPEAPLGYALIGVLVLIAVLYVGELAWAGLAGEAAVATFAVVLLLAVAATPSWGLLHSVCAVALLGLLFAYAALVFCQLARPAMLVHLAVPVLLLAATRFHSYGFWQKSLIVYFVVVAVVHQHLIRRRNSEAVGIGDGQADALLTAKARKVYRVEAGPVWNRRT
jgi:hypothetical protein